MVFQKPVNAEADRRRRGETTIKLRKEKRDENLLKRRNMNRRNDVTSTTSNDTNNDNFTNEKLQSLCEILVNGTNDAQTDAMRSIRRALSIEINPPVQQILDIGALALLVKSLNNDSNVNLQFEAAWALTNIASTDKTQVIVDSGAVPVLVKCMMSGYAELREQAAWCLGNVAGHDPALRDICLNHGALQPLLQNIREPHSLSLLQNCVWVLSNFVRGKPRVDINAISSAIPVLAELIKNDDESVKVDATWALSYISDGDERRIEEVIRHCNLELLTQMLLSEKTNVIIPALRTMGNFVTGTDSQTQRVIDSGVLAALVRLINHDKKNIRKETCWLISNIAAGTPNQKSELFQFNEILPAVLGQLSVSATWDVRKEAAYVISNLTEGTRAQVATLVELGALEQLCDLLDVGEVKMLVLAMDALEAIIKADGSPEKVQFIRLIDNCGGVEKLENLQEHECDEVYAKSVNLIELYFGGEDCEDENLAPEVVNGANVFSFGVSAQDKQSSLEGFNANKFQSFADNDADNSNSNMNFNGFGNIDNIPSF